MKLKIKENLTAEKRNHPIQIIKIKTKIITETTAIMMSMTEQIAENVKTIPTKDKITIKKFLSMSKKNRMKPKIINNQKTGLKNPLILSTKQQKIKPTIILTQLFT